MHAQNRYDRYKNSHVISGSVFGCGRPRSNQTAGLSVMYTELVVGYHLLLCYCTPHNSSFSYPSVEIVAHDEATQRSWLFVDRDGYRSDTSPDGLGYGCDHLWSKCNVAQWSVSSLQCLLLVNNVTEMHDCCTEYKCNHPLFFVCVSCMM